MTPTHTLKLADGKELILVSVPEDAKYFNTAKEGQLLLYKSANYTGSISLQGCKFLGTYNSETKLLSGNAILKSEMRTLLQSLNLTGRYALILKMK